MNAERENITPKIESDFLKRYQKVKEVRGQAIAELQNNSCGRCHIAIPPQLSIRVLKQEEMITCPNCHRILYVKPENIPEFNKMDV